MDDRSWAMPEEAPAPDVAAPVAIEASAGPASGNGSSATPTRRGSDASPPDLWVFHRTLTLADVLDGAFAVIKARPRTIIGLSALFILPVGLLVAVIDAGALGGDSLTALFDTETYDSEAADGGTSLGIGSTVLSAVIQSGLVTAIAAPMSRIIEAWYLRRNLGPLDAIRAVGIGWLWLAIAFVITRIVLIIGSLLLVLPGVAAMTLCSVAAPVIAVEGARPLAGIARSVRLVRRRFFPVLWICLFTALVSGLLSLVLPLLPVAVVEIAGLPGREIVVAMATIAASLIAFPFAAATAAIAYFDLRARNEGLDLHLAIDEAFGASSR